MRVFIIQRYKKLGKIQSEKIRIRKALLLAFFESIFMSGTLFGGSIGVHFMHYFQMQ